MTREHQLYCGMGWFLCYVATIVAANWSLERWGLINIGFGLMAPAGVLFAGVAFTFRDLLQEARGRWWSVTAIAVGSFVSWWISPSFAVASGVAFGISELADFAVYTPLRWRHWLAAVALSNTVGTVLDSFIFLRLADLWSRDAFLGLVVGKTYMTVIAVAVLWMLRRRAVSLRLRPAWPPNPGDRHPTHGQRPTA